MANCSYLYAVPLKTSVHQSNPGGLTKHFSLKGFESADFSWPLSIFSSQMLGCGSRDHADNRHLFTSPIPSVSSFILTETIAGKRKSPSTCPYLPTCLSSPFRLLCRVCKALPRSSSNTFLLPLQGFHTGCWACLRYLLVPFLAIQVSAPIEKPSYCTTEISKP